MDGLVVRRPSGPPGHFWGLGLAGGTVWAVETYSWVGVRQPEFVVISRRTSFLHFQNNMADTTGNENRLLSQGIRTPSDQPEVVAVPGDLRSLSNDGLSTACTARAVEDAAIAKNLKGDIGHRFTKPGLASLGKADGSRTRREGSRSRSRSRSLSDSEKREGSRSAEKRGSAPSLASCSVVLTRPRLVPDEGVSGVESAPPASPGGTGLEETWEGGSLRVSQLMSSTLAARTDESTPEAGFNPAECLPPQAYGDEPATTGVCSIRSNPRSVVELVSDEEEAATSEVRERRGSTASTGSGRGRGRPPGPNYGDEKVKAIREKRTPAPTKLSRNLEERTDEACLSYAEKLEKRSIKYDPQKDYSDVAQLGLLAYQKAKVEEETRAYQVMPAQELTKTIQRLLVEANEARRIGTANIKGTLSGTMLMGISCALIGVSQLASRIPENEEIESLKRTVDALIKVNVDLRKRLEQLEAQGVRPASAPVPMVEEGRKRPLSSPEEANVGAPRRRVMTLESLPSSSEENMETGETGPKPQRTAMERPEPTRADFLKNREVPPAQEVLVFDDTAIREAEAKRKGKKKKKKKKNPGRGEMELFSTVPSPQPPLRVEHPPAPDGYRPGAADRAVAQERTEEWRRIQEMGRFLRTPAEEYFPPLPQPRQEPPFQAGPRTARQKHAAAPATPGAPLTNRGGAPGAGHSD